MTLRRTFLLFMVPLFLLLAGVNGLLLYVWERAEAERGLENQAIAAAVTTAAFAAGGDGLAGLPDPRRETAIAAAAARVTGLEGLWISGDDGRGIRLAGDSARPPRLETLPQAPLALPVRAAADGERVVAGLAPVGDGRVVIAEIDAEPLFAQISEARRVVAILVIAAGVLGFLLAWVVARRIDGELARTLVMVRAAGDDGPAPDVEGFRIRETRDLALAVRLMRASVARRMARGRHELARRDRERDEAGAVAAYREEAFAPVQADGAGLAVAVRRLGDAPAGCFHAFVREEGRALLVLGECAGATPSAALAQALAARRFLDAHGLDGGAADRIDELVRAFGVSRILWSEWTSDAPGPPRLLALLDDDDAVQAEAYSRGVPDLPPGAVLDDLATLLDARGVVAALRPISGEGGQG